ncbi:MAG TPA: GNAT family N-acetyltransferase [Acetobacteraceae bacterium]|nr:GNAT family N-acetyltransferase [Acetobacteraceae bacterium]
MAAVIRPALPADRAAIERIVNAAYATYIPRIGKPPAPMLDDYAVRIAAGEVWVLDDGHPIGVVVLIAEPDHLLLDNIAVAPDCQGRGHGRRLLGFADAEAARRGHAVLRLYTHALMHENLALYLAQGWREYARGSQSGYDRVFMEKRLTADPTLR